MRFWATPAARTLRRAVTEVEQKSVGRLGAASPAC